LRSNVLPPFDIVAEGVLLHVEMEALIDGDMPVAGVFDLVGHIDLPPKAWIRFVRAEIRKLENIARDAGCVEFRIAGRDWSRILRDYEPMNHPDVPNGLRKRL
jgi:hypothetical protein